MAGEKMASKLLPGLSHKLCRQVQIKDLASEVGSGLVNVFSTAMLVAGMEEAAVATVQPFLEADQTTVGVGLDISHRAATPLNMQVCFQATLLEISKNSRSLIFHVEAHDEMELIGEGTHRRVIVNKEEFEAKTANKAIGK